MPETPAEQVLQPTRIDVHVAPPAAAAPAVPPPVPAPDFDTADITVPHGPADVRDDFGPAAKFLSERYGRAYVRSRTAQPHGPDRVPVGEQRRLLQQALDTSEASYQAVRRLHNLIQRLAWEESVRLDQRIEVQDAWDRCAPPEPWTETERSTAVLAKEAGVAMLEHDAAVKALINGFPTRFAGKGAPTVAAMHKVLKQCAEQRLGEAILITQAHMVVAGNQPDPDGRQSQGQPRTALNGRWVGSYVTLHQYAEAAVLAQAAEYLGDSAEVGDRYTRQAVEEVGRRAGKGRRMLFTQRAIESDLAAEQQVAAPTRENFPEYHWQSPKWLISAPDTAVSL